jgi:hypothetical protein
MQRPKFDWRQMQRWGISESNLPPRSRVLLREPTVWEKYQWQAALIASVMLVQAALIADCFMSAAAAASLRSSSGNALQSLHMSTAIRQPMN